MNTVNPLTLPSSFAAMAARPQWFIYRLYDRDAASGKYLKHPWDARTRAPWPKDGGKLAACTEWPTVARVVPELNATAAQGERFVPGYYFTAADPFWFLDIDGCVVTDANGVRAWSPLALQLLASFPGAARETSSSGQGWHIIGSGASPPHGCKNKALGLEFYTADRGVAMTFENVSGDVSADCTPQVAQLVAAYFPSDGAAEVGEWRDGPIEGSRPIADDDALIAKARASHSRKAEAVKAFGSGVAPDAVSFEDLWTGNADVLGHAYPPKKSSDSWDRSSADFALACALVWWTCHDHERTQNLMLQSALDFDRSHKARDYKARTILNASAARASDWYGKNREPIPHSAPPATAGTLAPTPPNKPVPHLDLSMNSRGRYEAVLENLVYILSMQDATRIGFDTFRDRIMIARAGSEDWRPLTDTDMVTLRESMAREQGFAAISRDIMLDSMRLVAERHKFDSAIVWLSSLVWDGVPRVEQFLATYCGAADDDYSRAVSLYIWTALADRVLVPGSQCDMVVALQSPQGKLKSTGLQSLAPDPELFTDGLELHIDDADFKRMIRGKLVCEIAEMAGLSKADVSHIKRTITRRFEEWVEKWQTQPTRYPRRCLLFATTNDERFLPRDDTGNRRWLPVQIERIERERIAADRAQLWAEAVSIYRARGQCWQDAERLAAGRHGAFEQRDVWEDTIAQWLDTPSQAPGAPPAPPPGSRPLSVGEVLSGALHLSHSQQDQRAEKRAATVLRQLGFEVRNVRDGGSVARRWVRNVRNVQGVADV